MIIKLIKSIFLLLIIVGGTSGQAYAEKQSLSDPDMNNRQDVVDHFKQAAKVCEAFSEGLSGRSQCVNLCLHSARKTQDYSKNFPDKNKSEWEQCKRWYDGAFYSHSKAENKKKLASISPPANTGEQVSSDPNMNNNQDVTDHFQRAAKACKSLPDDQYDRKKCVKLCSYFAKRRAPYSRNYSEKVNQREWESCKAWQDSAFDAYDRIAHKKKKSDNDKNIKVVSGNGPARNNTDTIITGKEVSSTPDFSNKQDVIEHLQRAAQACETLPENVPLRKSCIDVCFYASQKVPTPSTSYSKKARKSSWNSCKTFQDKAFNVFNQRNPDCPVIQNDPAWGYNETDSYWYGGRVYDVTSSKVFLRHSNNRKQWYLIKDIKKFVPKGLVEVNKNGKYYQAKMIKRDQYGNLFARYIGGVLPHTPDQWNSRTKIRRETLGLDDDMDSVSIEDLRRVSEEDKFKVIGVAEKPKTKGSKKPFNPEYWSSRLAFDINSDKFTVEDVILQSQSPIKNSLHSSELRKFVDDYLESWIKEEVDYFKKNIAQAPLYEVAWASNYVAEFPNPSRIDELEKTKKQILSVQNDLVPLIEQRIATLEKLAMDVIHESGADYTDVETVFETGFALAEEFEEAGYIAQGQKLIAVTIEYIDHILKTGFQQYKDELKDIKLTDEKITALQEQIVLFEELSAEFDGFNDYKKAAKDILQADKNTICENVLKDSGVKSSNFDKLIGFGKKQITLRKLAYDLCIHNHIISEFSKASLKTYKLSIAEANNTKSSFYLKSDALFFGKEFEIEKRLGNEEKPITEAEWQTYITNLIHPPSGKPDEKGIRECDKLAADPHDTQKLGKGMDFDKEDINPKTFNRTIDACIAAIEHDPNDARQQFQLGRLLWYAGDTETANEYLGLAADANYAPAFYYKAEMLLTESEDNNAFVDALHMYEASGKGGYERGNAMVKELNPDGLDFFREIPPPTEKQLFSAIAESTNRQFSMLGLKASFILKKVKIIDCFQVSATDFSCEYDKAMDCNTKTTHGYWNDDWRVGLMSGVFQMDCNSVPISFGTFRKQKDGNWKDIAQISSNNTNEYKSNSSVDNVSADEVMEALKNMFMAK